jgi:hypothetical protein
MDGIAEQHGFVTVEMVQQDISMLDEAGLLGWIELARYFARLAVRHAKPVQQRDQARSSLINHSPFSLDPGSHPACRAWQGCDDPRRQWALLSVGQATRAAFVTKACKPLDAAFLIQARPNSDRIVVQQ